MTLKFDEPLILGTKYEFNPEVFDAIGNPNITEEGILSNINTSNYVKTANAPIADDSAFEISATFKMTDDDPWNQAIWGVDNLNEWFNYLQVFKNYIAFRMQFSDNTNYTMLYSMTVKENTEYRVIISWDKAVYRMKIYEEGELLTTLEYESELSLKAIGSAKLFIGRSQWGDPIYYLRGDINLKAFKIVVEGETVLSGGKIAEPKWEVKPFRFDIERIN